MHQCGFAILVHFQNMMHSYVYTSYVHFVSLITVNYHVSLEAPQCTSMLLITTLASVYVLPQMFKCASRLSYCYVNSVA